MMNAERRLKRLDNIELSSRQRITRGLQGQGGVVICPGGIRDSSK